MHTRVARAGDLHLTLHRAAGEPLEHDLLDALAYFRVVAVARHVHQAGVEAVIGIAPREQAYRAPLVQVDDTAGDPDQILEARLEKLVPRIGFQHVEDGFAVMTVRVDAEVLDDAIDLAPQQRDVARTEVIGGGGPQPEEAVLAGDPAAGIEGLDARVVEILGAMHGRDGVGLGQDEELPIAGASADIARQHGRGGLAAPRAAGCRARCAVGNQAILAGAALEPVIAVAEEDEMTLLHPLQELAGLAEILGGQGRRVALQIRDQRAHSLAHRRPVVDREGDIGQRRFDVVAQPLQRRRIGLTVDLVQLPGFRPVRLAAVRAQAGQAAAPITADLEHRVNDEMHGEAGAGEGDTDGVDQKGPVIGHDLHQRVRRLEAIALPRRD